MTYQCYSRRFGLPLVITILSTSLLSAGCSNDPGSKKQNVPTPAIQKSSNIPINIFGIDRSGSTARMREQQKAVVTAGFIFAGKRREKVGVYVVDSKSAPVFSVREISKRERPLPSVLKEFDTVTSVRGSRTRPAAFWKQMSDDYAASNPTIRIRINYVTDGDNDWAMDARKINEYINRLSQNPNVYIALIGLDKDQVEPLKKQFRPFGERCTFSIGTNQGEMIDAVSSLRLLGN